MREVPQGFFRMLPAVVLLGVIVGHVVFGPLSQFQMQLSAVLFALMVAGAGLWFMFKTVRSQNMRLLPYVFPLVTLAVLTFGVWLAHSKGLVQGRFGLPLVHRDEDPRWFRYALTLNWFAWVAVLIGWCAILIWGPEISN